MVSSKQILLILPIGSVCAIDLSDGSCGDDDVALLQTKLTPVSGSGFYLQDGPSSPNSAESPKINLVADLKKAKRKERHHQREVRQKPEDPAMSSAQWTAFCDELSNCASESDAVAADIDNFAAQCVCSADADSTGMTSEYYGFASVETFKKTACGCPDANSGVDEGSAGGDGGAGGDSSDDADASDGNAGTDTNAGGSDDASGGSADASDGNAGDDTNVGGITDTSATATKVDVFVTDSAPDMSTGEWDAFCAELAACTTSPGEYPCSCDGTPDGNSLSFNYYGFHAKVKATKDDCGCA